MEGERILGTPFTVYEGGLGQDDQSLDSIIDFGVALRRASFRIVPNSVELDGALESALGFWVVFNGVRVGVAGWSGFHEVLPGGYVAVTDAIIDLNTAKEFHRELDPEKFERFEKFDLDRFSEINALDVNAAMLLSQDSSVMVRFLSSLSQKFHRQYSVPNDPQILEETQRWLANLGQLLWAYCRGSLTWVACSESLYADLSAHYLSERYF